MGRLHAAGLKAPGGRPSGRWWKAARDERELVERRLSDLIEALPAGPVDKPVEQWTHSQLLDDTARQGLMRVREIVMTPITDALDPKEKRLIGEMGIAAAKLLAGVQASALQRESSDKWADLMARITAAKERP